MSHSLCAKSDLLVLFFCELSQEHSVCIFLVIYLKVLQVVVPISLYAETRNSTLESQVFRPVGSSVTKGLIDSLKIIWRKAVILKELEMGRG